MQESGRGGSCGKCIGRRRNFGTIGSTDAEAEAGANVIIHTNPDDAVASLWRHPALIYAGDRHRNIPWHLSKGMKPELKALDLLKEIKSKSIDSAGNCLRRL